MNLGWINENKTEAQLKSVILHEFGHTLGLLHEHMNPMSNIRWNKDMVYAYYMQYQGWDKEMVDRQVFDRYSVTMTNKSYDPKSIMHYPIPANFTTDGYTVGENYDLSDNDKKLITELYPFNKIVLVACATVHSMFVCLKFASLLVKSGNLVGNCFT